MYHYFAQSVLHITTTKGYDFTAVEARHSIISFRGCANAHARWRATWGSRHLLLTRCSVRGLGISNYRSGCPTVPKDISKQSRARCAIGSTRSGSKRPPFASICSWSSRQPSGRGGLLLVGHDIGDVRLRPIGSKDSAVETSLLKIDDVVPFRSSGAWVIDPAP